MDIVPEVYHTLLSSLAPVKEPLLWNIFLYEITMLYQVPLAYKKYGLCRWEELRIDLPYGSLPLVRNVQPEIPRHRRDGWRCQNLVQLGEVHTV